MNYKKQSNLFAIPENEDNKKYTSKIEAPIYEPKNKKPHLLELCDKTKTSRLISEIETSDIDEDINNF